MQHSIYKKINGSDEAPFSKRLVSGMMFRRQSNQSAHAGVEISQREEEGGGNCGGRKAQSFFFNFPSRNIFMPVIRTRVGSPPPSCPWRDQLPSPLPGLSHFSLLSNRQPSGGREVRGGNGVITIRGVECSITAIPICDPTSS